MTAQRPRSRQQPKHLDAGIFQAEINSFALRLAAEGKAAKTIRTYTGAVQWFAAARLQVGRTNPAWEPGRDKHEQYREHVLAALQASPWARVIKASDFTDNAVGIIHTTEPARARP